MGALYWVVAGAMAGFVCSKLVYRDAQQLMRDVLVGILGALAGGVVYRELGFHSLQPLNAGSMLVAVAGSVALLVLYRILGVRQADNT
jgi:uncharacterized membrane protein YeaQ/YmgE (transglycosylase-associated protein family)